MTRKFETFIVTDVAVFKNKMLNWANRFNIFCLLDNHNYKLPYHTQECLFAVGSVKELNVGDNFFASLDSFYNTTNDWIFGHFNYDLKNEIEELTSNNNDPIAFPDAFLFVPQILIQLQADEVLIGAVGVDASQVLAAITQQEVTLQQQSQILLQPKIPKPHYLEIVEKLRDHIKRGDCYEINFCHEFFAQNVSINPTSVYEKLIEVSPNPFSAFYKLRDKFVMCASPERYLKKNSTKIVSQPIKGTSPRNVADSNLDRQLKEKLSTSEKERSENVMIVDLVRNDLSKICKEGTVEVEHLYHVQTFPGVHQMVSTVKGEIENNLSFAEIIKATFPMGSMTGAPKKRVMELIDLYEQTRRGIYSGTIGYITPEKDFDFNVVIRSIMYNRGDRYISCQVGGAITYNSDPEMEYEECLTKISAIKKVLR